MRRYVTDAGPLLDRLHALVRSDCTTRNRRRAAALQRSYDSLEQRIAALRAQEELDAIRPDLDGNAIMALLGIPPGPLVGRAYKHLLALRMERGPLGAEAAEAELRRWAAENGVGVTSTGRGTSRPSRCRRGHRRPRAPLRGPARRSCRSWASRPSTYTPAVAAISHGARPSGGAEQRRDGDRQHVADVEHRVVEREHPPARLVAHLALHGGVGAQLHHLPRQAQQERRRRAPPGRVSHAASASWVAAAASRATRTVRARPRWCTSHGVSTAASAEPGRGQRHRLAHAGHPGAQHARRR